MHKGQHAFRLWVFINPCCGTKIDYSDRKNEHINQKLKPRVIKYEKHYQPPIIFLSICIALADLDFFIAKPLMLIAYQSVIDMSLCKRFDLSTYVPLYSLRHKQREKERRRKLICKL